MNNRWTDRDAVAFVKECSTAVPEPLVQQVYATRLLGAEADLSLHGGGNTSVKCRAADLLGETRECLFIKASGAPMAGISPDRFVALDIERLKGLRARELADEDLASFFRLSLLRPHPGLPSIETLLHLYLPYVYIDHTHPAAILALTNRHDAAACLREAFGTSVAVMPYAAAGFPCGRAAVEAVRGAAGCSGLVMMQHGLVTWGASAREAYNATIKMVSLAETYLVGKRVRPLAAQKRPSPTEAAARYAAVAPLLRGLLSPASGNPDAPYKRIVLRHLAGEALLDFLSCGEAEAIALSVPLTPDYLIRTKRVPLFVASPRYDDTAALREQLTAAVQTYRDEYRSYVTCCGRTDAPPADDADLLPRVVLLPGLGAVCAGETARDAGMAADITAQCLSVKRTIYETGGTYASLSPEHCCAMEFRSYQRAKLAATSSARPLEGCVVLVTGAAGAIGAGLCAALLENGCHLAVSDLAGDALDQTVGEFDARFGGERVLGVAMDVTDSASVEEGFRSICSRFGGLDAAVVNAGIAHVARLADMDMEAFRRLERVNIEGTLLTIREATRLFRLQNTGGDIVLVSTKNVFAPGASFGAYSATKAASHQLARIAALELADLGVRVNMVAPDAVFSHGGRKSGLWAAVGPDRMKARGLDEAGLEEYYRSRNLLKARVTAGHVAAAVLFFLRRETPTTGATIPVDGGLPDATPR